MVSAVDLLRCVLALDHLLRTDLLAINPREFWVVFHVNFVFLSRGFIDCFRRGFIEVRPCSRPFAQDGFIGNKSTWVFGCFPCEFLSFSRDILRDKFVFNPKMWQAPVLLSVSNGWLGRFLSVSNGGSGFGPYWVRIWTKHGTDLNKNGHGCGPKWVRIWPEMGADLSEHGHGFGPKWVRTWPRMGAEFRQVGYKFETEWMGFEAMLDVSSTCLACAFGASAGRQDYYCRTGAPGGYWQ